MCLWLLCLVALSVPANADWNDPAAPSGLSFAGRSWFNQYIALNRARLEFYAHVHRDYGAKRAYPCLPFAPPRTSKDAQLSGLTVLLTPLDTLSRADRRRLTPWLRLYTSSPVNEANYAQFDLRRHPEFAAEDAHIRQTVNDERKRSVGGIVGKAAILAVLLGAVWLVLRRTRRRLIRARPVKAAKASTASSAKPKLSDDAVPGGNR